MIIYYTLLRYISGRKISLFLYRYDISAATMRIGVRLSSVFGAHLHTHYVCHAEIRLQKKKKKTRPQLLIIKSIDICTRQYTYTDSRSGPASTPILYYTRV